ncbi:MAG: porin, partial [Rhodospirillales bacterium]
LLLGSTALAAAGLFTSGAFAADPIHVTVNGYYQYYLVFGNYDRVKTFSAASTVTGSSEGRSSRLAQEGEIWFNGVTKLDNGTSVGFRVELEAYTQQNNGTSAGDQIDEMYLIAFGDWGRMEVGGTNGPMDKMVYGSPSALPGFGLVSSNFNFYNPGTNNAFSTAIQGDRNLGDANKVIYYTPRFAGIQIGVSYTPVFQPGLNGNACGATGGYGGQYGVCNKNVQGQYKNAIDAGINYLAKFNSLDLAVYGGFMTASPSNNLSASSKDVNRRWWHWLTGAQLTYQGFSVGGYWGRDNNGVVSGNATRIYSAAFTYTTGPWQLGAGWRRFVRDENASSIANLIASGAAGKDRYDYYEAGVNYKLGPGITLVGGLNWNQGHGQRSDERVSAWQVFFGTALVF